MLYNNSSLIVFLDYVSTPESNCNLVKANHYSRNLLSQPTTRGKSSPLWDVHFLIQDLTIRQTSKVYLLCDC